MYIRSSTTNCADNVLESFCTACNKYGVPSRVRADHGNENMLVGVLMNVLRGTNRGSFITGRSVHNQRIERLWRDVHKEVTQSLYVKFYDMEDAGKLQTDNDIHRLALRTVFLPILNDRLSQFATAWNSHRIRTAHNNTPNQLWVAGMVNAQSGSQTVANELLEGHNSTLHERVMQKLAELGVDTSDAADDPIPRNSQEAISLTTEQQDELQATIGSISDVNEKFDTCITKLNEILQQNVHD